MDIWIGRCKKSAECNYCGETIENGEPAVFGKLWRQYGAEGGEVRKWTKKFRWHARRKRDGQCCWAIQGLENFDSTPYTETRGRRPLVISKEMRETRLRLLRRHAKVMQRLRVEMESGKANVDVLIHLGSRLETLKEEISQVGGVPKSWG